MDTSVNALGGAAENQNAQIQVAQVKQAANSVIKKLTDIREERESTAAEREKVKRKIQTMGGPVSEWKTTVLQIVAITLAAVLLTYFVFSFVLPPTVNMSIAIAGMLVGVGYAIYFTVTKQ
jgi:mannose/fructose/N-acetylgalactosamine-specific phosphotransferase system component IIC